jgi:hypothetical protein
MDSTQTATETSPPEQAQTLQMIAASFVMSGMAAREQLPRSIS